MKDSDDDSSLRIRWIIASISLPIFILALSFISGKATAENRSTVVENSQGGTINAVLVRSWNDCNSISTVWESLNNNWSNYGTTPINIDYNNSSLCSAAATITYANLVASGADVVILSDPAGGERQYSSAEIAALQAYAQDGHNILGTYLLLEFEATDNRELAPIFGLAGSGNFTFTTTPLTPTYNFLEPNNPLFNNMGANYVSGGFPFYQIPLSDGTWDNGDLDGARYVAKTSDNAAVITVYDAPTYSAIYIANMPEYESGAIDERFIYNALTYRANRQIFLPAVLK